MRSCLTTIAKPAKTKAAKIIVASVGIILAILSVSMLAPISYGEGGTIDFVQYWRSWHLTLQGQNPYDFALAQEAQDSVTGVPKPLIISWNPPWTFVLLAPFLILPFENSTTLWFLVQFVLLGAISIITPIALGAPRPPLLLSALAVTLFFPALSSIYFGQLGVLIAASVALFLFFERRGQLYMAGLSLIPLSIKPHLLFLFIIPGLKWLIQLPRPQAIHFLLGALGGFAALVALTFVIAPSIIPWWVAAMMGGPTGEMSSHAVPFQHWQTTTLTTWIRILLSTETTPTWPLTLVPLTALALTATYFVKTKGPIIWREVTPPLLCFSLLMNNYGWVFDQSVLIVCQITLICCALRYTNRSRKITLISAAFLVQLLAIATSRLPQHYYVWLPLAMLALLYLEKHLSLLEKEPRA